MKASMRELEGTARAVREWRHGLWEAETERFVALRRRVNETGTGTKVRLAIDILRQLSGKDGLGRLRPANDTAWLEYEDAMTCPLTPPECGCVLFVPGDCVGFDLAHQGIVASDGSRSVVLRAGGAIVKTTAGCDHLSDDISIDAHEDEGIITLGQGPSQCEMPSLDEARGLIDLACDAMDEADGLCAGLAGYARDVMAGRAVDLADRTTWHE